ncbi:MAG TPA: nucleotide exchange factor GrpE [Syntrophales bacterium]|nr:nucleotide exchange factor GrpE [Syntrophales bacterium]HOL59450.1 nucleotide exchange factor GrpE [Syntrophales bacterium]HPO34632.1 nucleotide exchange factor GrpE [Syntrophales bacterium]
MKKEKNGEKKPAELIKEGEASLSLEDECARLRERLAEKEKEAAENYDRYLRAMAELDNFRKRTAREKEELVRFGNENLLRDILPLIDNLDRALAHAEASENFAAFKDGLLMVRDQFMRTLEKHGLSCIECVSKEFDPNYHEALFQVDSPHHNHNQVVEELEKGYLLHGKLLRPAKVSVCKKTESSADNCEQKDAVKA